MPKPTVLLLGPGVQYTQDFYNNTFLNHFNVVQDHTLNRADFITALQSKSYGPFSATLKPHVETGVSMSPWDTELISLLPSSCLIFAAGGAGYDSVDTDALGRRGIWYANGAGAGDNATSDAALWHVLCCFRHFTKGVIAARSCEVGEFERAHGEVAGTSVNPRGRVLGVVGFGGIGRMVARKAGVALGMVVHYHDVVRAGEEVERESGNATWHADLESLLRVADCVTLHVPLNTHTRDLMNERTIGMMKDGARLVNTARGQVVEEQSLIAALRSGKLSAAGIDVHYNEPRVSRALAQMENVTLTPHLGGVARETIEAFEMIAMRNVLAVVGAEGEVVGEPATGVNGEVVRRALKGA